MNCSGRCGQLCTTGLPAVPRAAWQTALTHFTMTTWAAPTKGSVSQEMLPVSILKIPKLSLLRGFKMYIWEIQLRQLFFDSRIGRAGEEG